VEIEGWVVKPGESGGPCPTVLCIHGGPFGTWGYAFNEEFLALTGHGFAVAVANPRGSTGYGDGFSTVIRRIWGDLELVDLNAFIDEVVRLKLADPDRLGVTGYSGGGHLTAWLIGHSGRFKAAVPEQGVYNMTSMYGVSDARDLIELVMDGAPHEDPERYWLRSPIAYAHKVVTPTLLIQGEDDIRCPMEQAEQLFSLLIRHGCRAELLRLKGCNHSAQVWGDPDIRRNRMSAMIDWFERHLFRVEGALCSEDVARHESHRPDGH
jgi:dipeptidyl aminopeptidase/acylaminoacyl peptidase